MIKKNMLKVHTNHLNMLLRVFDLVIVFVAGYVTYYFSPAYITYSSLGVSGVPDHYLDALQFSLVATFLLFSLFNIYQVWRGVSILTELKKISVAWLTVGLLLTAIAFITKSGSDYSRYWIVVWFASAWVLLIIFRGFVRVILRYLRSSGFNNRHIVIVGTGDQAIVVADRLRRSTWFGLEISALYGGVNGNLPSWLEDKLLINNVEDLRNYVDENSVDQVWICLPHTEEKTISDVINVLDESSVEVRYVPDIFEYQLMHHSLLEIAGVPIVNISYSSIDGFNKVIKAAEDYILASILLLLLSPLMLIIAIWIKISSKGPVLYRQQRVGWNGKEFTMFKFRSMPVDAESHSGPVWSNKDDNRATGFGSLLRKSSLDELPQLFNVLYGEMSLIGPRPERPMFVEKYKDEVPHYMKKHLVKAGLTGWAQVHGWRGNTCLHSRIEHDLYYIENWSLWLDIKIIFLTVFKGLVDENAY